MIRRSKYHCLGNIQLNSESQSNHRYHTTPVFIQILRSTPYSVRFIWPALVKLSHQPLRSYYEKMYWPLGAPRIYAASDKPRRKSGSGLDDPLDGDPTDEDDPTLTGLQISRNGHLFATITTTTLMIWQTSVCREL